MKSKKIPNQTLFKEVIEYSKKLKILDVKNSREGKISILCIKINNTTKAAPKDYHISLPK